MSLNQKESSIDCYKDRVGVICGYPFPQGMAATNRIIAYSKGLVENNMKVDIYLFNPTEISNEKLPKSGSYKGINYCYPFKRNRVKNKIVHGFEIILGLICSFFKIIKENSKEKYKALIISSDSISKLLMFGLLCKIKNIRFIFIFDEYPIPIRGKLKSKIPFWKTFFYKIALKNVSAYISISHNLASYYNSLCSKETFILPVITDVSRFSNTEIDKNSNDSSNYICYMGNMELSKDNIDVIIKAFSLISEKHPNLELHLYGKPNHKSEKIIKALIKELSLTDKVLFKGVVKYNTVPKVLQNAKLLVSSQPATLRARGGFPTKMGEYLASGTPALMTNVGENSKYVTSGEHLFFADPGNHEVYAQKMDYILDNYQIAKKVALTGKQFLIENYSHNAMGEKLKNFIVSLN